MGGAKLWCLFITIKRLHKILSQLEEKNDYEKLLLKIKDGQKLSIVIGSISYKQISQKRFAITSSIKSQQKATVR